jgi:hypothetical protein
MSTDEFHFPNWAVLQNMSRAPQNPRPAYTTTALPSSQNFGGLTGRPSTHVNKIWPVGTQGAAAIYHYPRGPFK